MLSPSEAHVWLADVGACDHLWPGCLSPSEERAAELIGVAEERRRFRGTRGLARHVLGRYFGCSPARVPLARRPSGQPFVASRRGRRLGLSLSHSGSQVALAMALEPVGVDVEQERPVHAMDRLAAWLREALPLHLQPPLEPTSRRQFFQAWSRREACLKALGLGVAAAPPGLSWRSLRVVDLSLAEGYAGALCVAPSCRQIVVRHPRASRVGSWRATRILVSDPAP